MNPQRAQLRIALISAAISALVVVALSAIAVHGGTDRIRSTSQRELTDSVSKLVAEIDLNAVPTDKDDAWLVDVDNEVARKLDEKTTLEPPLIGLGKDIIEQGPQFREFAQDGSQFVLYGQRLPNSPLVVTVAKNLAAERAEIESWRLRLWLLAALLIVATALLSYFVAGWALRPSKTAHEQQRVFLANAAHELRTPLAVIRASASQVLDRPRSAQEYAESLGEINVAAMRASDLVSDMLELARLDAGQTIPRRAPLRLDLLGEEIAAVVRHDGVSVESRSVETVVVDADYGLLRQAVENLVRNAMRHATVVTIAVRRDGADATIAVSDNGAGFGEAMLATVFDRFRRGDGELDREGTGLGLAIVASVVAAHGGSVYAENVAAGGAMVTIRLPRARR